MGHSKREIERKYEAPSGSADVVLPELAGAGGVHAVVDRDLLELDAVYYDTADERLAAAGLTLRRRTGGADEGWHLKIPVAEDEREEIQVPLQAGVPGELGFLVRAFTRDAELAPRVRIVSRREVRHLLDKKGALLAEAGLDRVRAERIGGTTAEWTEIEIELADGAPPALLDKVEKRLRKAGLSRSGAPSKLAAALERTDPGAAAEPAADAEPTADANPGAAGAAYPGAAGAAVTGAAPEAGADPLPPGSAGAYVLDYLRAQRDTLIAWDPAVRRDLPDAVHRMRVATRRLRSALRSYANVLDRAVTDPLGTELKWLAAELGADRDLEVLGERLDAHLGDVAPELVEGPVPQRIGQWLSGRREDSRDLVVEALDSDRYLALLDRLDALLAAPPLRSAARAKARKPVREAVRGELKRLGRRLDRANATEPGPERNAALHEARKKAKRARYAAEAAEPLLGSRAKRLVKDLKRLQKLLGEHQDSVVARGALRDLAAQAFTSGESDFTYGLLHGREERTAADCEDGLPGARRRVAHSAKRFRHA